MTGAAMVFMSVSVLFVVLLAAWCYYLVLRPGADSDDRSRPGNNN